jgi:hypothetical protein
MPAYRKGFSRRAVTAAFIIGLLIGVGVTFALVGASVIRTTTTTTTLPAVTRTTTTTVSQTSQAVATVASSGLRLSTSINATEITAGQKLDIAVSVFNTLPTANGLNVENVFGEFFVPPNPGEVGNWTFYGLPIATWPECDGHPYDWPYPIGVVVLSGNYTGQQLASLANTTLPLPCDGGFSPTFPYATFAPNSDLVNLTAQFDGGVGIRPIGQFQLASNFTVGGYWNLADLAGQADSSYVCEPAASNSCASLPPSTPFGPGVYTIGVSDEWGQYDVLHFQVGGSG